MNTFHTLNGERADFLAKLADKAFVSIKEDSENRYGRDVGELMRSLAAFMVGMNTHMFVPVSAVSKEAAMQGFEALVKDLRRTLSNAIDEVHAQRSREAH